MPLSTLSTARIVGVFARSRRQLPIIADGFDNILFSGPWAQWRAQRHLSSQVVATGIRAA
jgi:hypothetical protein